MYSYNEFHCFVYAIRYAAGRNTSAASIIIQTILTNWDKFNKEMKNDLKNEAEKFATCNKDEWAKLIDKEF